MSLPLIYAGIHQPAMAAHLTRAMLSVNRLLNRKSDFAANGWILDSGAFTRITTRQAHLTIREYAGQIRRWSRCGELHAAIAQDMMCEPFVLGITGLTVERHQDISTLNYLRLRESLGSDACVMPVLQGFEPREYAQHTREMSAELPQGCWTGVGSVCKRQGNPAQIARVLEAIREIRPDLRLHGFGVKTTALREAAVVRHLHSVDSMAWSLAARREYQRAGPGGRNSMQECLKWVRRMEAIQPRNSQLTMEI